MTDPLRNKVRKAWLAWGLLAVLAAMLSAVGLVSRRHHAPVVAVSPSPSVPPSLSPLPVQAFDVAPSPAPLTYLYSPSLDPTGHWVVLIGARKGDPQPNLRLWVIDTEGHDLYCLWPGPVRAFLNPLWEGTVSRLAFTLAAEGGEPEWLARPVKGAWRVTPAPPEMQRDAQLSPSGRYLVVPDRGGPGVEPAEAGKMEITASHRALFRLPLPVMGWSPDEKTLYVEKTTRAGQATISVELLGYDMYSGARRSLGKFRGETYLDLSPDGKWIAVNAERDVRGFKWLGTLPVSLTLLNRSTGARHVFPKWSAQDWAPGGRYLWCKAFTLKPPSETAHVVDLHSLREVATIGRKQLRGAVPYEEQFSPRGDWVLINVYGPQAIPPEGWYDIVVARANGTGVRSLKPFGIVPWGNSRFLGWTWDGDLLTWLQKERKLVRLNPQTGARKVIYPPGG